MWTCNNCKKENWDGDPICYNCWDASPLANVSGEILFQYGCPLCVSKNFVYKSVKVQFFSKKDRTLFVCPNCNFIWHIERRPGGIKWDSFNWYKVVSEIGNQTKVYYEICDCPECDGILSKYINWENIDRYSSNSHSYCYKCDYWERKVNGLSQYGRKKLSDI